MWMRLLQVRKDNPLCAQSRRRWRRRWWRSWVAPGVLGIVALYGFLFSLRLGWVDGPAAAANPNALASEVFRLFLFVLSPLATFLGFVVGARSIQIERERQTLDPLLLTALDDLDLMAGKIFASLLPFVAVCLLLVPGAFLFRETTMAMASTLLAPGRFVDDLLHGLQRTPSWEMLVSLFLGSVLGVVFGIHRAVHHRRAVVVYSAGMVTFLLVATFLITTLSHLFQALLVIPVRLVVSVRHDGLLLDLAPYESPIRLFGAVGAVWLATLPPLYELADRFRYLCAEEQDPRALRARPPPRKPAPPPVPWTAARRLPPGARAETPAARFGEEDATHRDAASAEDPVRDPRWAEWERRQQQDANAESPRIVLPRNLRPRPKNRHDS